MASPQHELCELRRDAFLLANSNGSHGALVDVVPFVRKGNSPADSESPADTRRSQNKNLLASLNLLDATRFHDEQPGVNRAAGKSRISPGEKSADRPVEGGPCFQSFPLPALAPFSFAPLLPLPSAFRPLPLSFTERQETIVPIVHVRVAVPVPVLKHALAKETLPVITLELVVDQRNLLRDVDWQTYIALSDTTDRPGCRLTYDRGELEISRVFHYRFRSTCSDCN